MPEGVEIKPKIKKGPRTPKGKGRGGDDDSAGGAQSSDLSEADNNDEPTEEIVTPRKTTARQRGDKRKPVADEDEAKPVLAPNGEASKDSGKKVSESVFPLTSKKTVTDAQPLQFTALPHHPFLVKSSLLHLSRLLASRSIATSFDRYKQWQARPQIGRLSWTAGQEISRGVVRALRCARMIGL